MSHPTSVPTGTSAPTRGRLIYVARPAYVVDYWPSYGYQYPYGQHMHSAPPASAPVSEEPPKAVSAQEAIESIIKTFENRVNEFTFPTRLDFVKPSSDGQVPMLALTENNKPFNGYKSSLEDLVAALKRVRSHGDKGVRVTRAAVIKQIESELVRLKHIKAMLWWDQLRAAR